MIDYPELRDAIAAAVGELGVRTYSQYPPSITPPAIVVEFPTAIEYNRTGCLDTFTLTARLFTSHSTDGERQLCTLASHEGVPAQVATVPGARPVEARMFGSVSVGGADFYTCEVRIEVTA